MGDGGRSVLAGRGARGLLRDEVLGLVIAGPVVVPGWWSIWHLCDAVAARI